MIEFCRTLFSGSRPFFYHIKKEKPPHRWFLFFRAGKGFDGFASHRFAAGLPPFGLIACAIIPKFALRTSSMIEFCRTLFSGSSTLFTNKIKNDTIEVSFLISSGKRVCLPAIFLACARLRSNPSGLHSLRSCQAQNLSLRTSCMRQNM